MKSKTETWKEHPNIAGVEVSTFGRVRMLDRVVSTEKRTQFTKGHVLNQYYGRGGYLVATVPVDVGWAAKLVHRLVAQTFLPNPDNLPEVNHKSCDRRDNRVINLEWCSREYNMQYREKVGEAQGHPLFAVNLFTLEVLHFRSQTEASQALGVNLGSINSVIKGKRKRACGFWFTNADDKAVDLTKQKLREIDKTRLTAADAASAEFVSQFNTKSLL